MGLISQAVYEGGRHVIGWACSWFGLMMLYIFNLLKSTDFCPAFSCRVIPKTLMPREVMLRSFGSISLEIKKKMTKHICRGDTENYLHLFPISPQYICSCSNSLTHTLFQVNFHHIFVIPISELHSCPLLWFMCGSQWEELELVYYLSFMSHIVIYLFIIRVGLSMNIEYWIGIHLAIWGLSPLKHFVLLS